MLRPRFTSEDDFQVLSAGRFLDRKTGTLTVNIAYRTRTRLTSRTRDVITAFGLGGERAHRFHIYRDLRLSISPSDVVYITGDSGSGKSVLLRELERLLGSDAVININNVKPDLHRPIIETVGETVEQGLNLLSQVGLNDAFLFLRPYSQLSDGQRYRYRIAKMIEAGKQFWVMDEFCSLLDRDTAKIVAYNLQKLARRHGKAIIAATSHTDLKQDLNPTLLINKSIGEEVTVEHIQAEPAHECSILKEIAVMRAGYEEYKRLAPLHYRESSSRLPGVRSIFAAKRAGNQLCGAIVYCISPFLQSGRRQALNARVSFKMVQRDFQIIARVIVHPKYRSVGLGVKLVKESLPLSGSRYVETVAVMARYNPFFERAGMSRICEIQPKQDLVEAVEQLKRLKFDPVLMLSRDHTLKMLQARLIREHVKKTLTETIRSSGVNYRRLSGTAAVNLSRSDFQRALKCASAEKLAGILRRLAIMVQPKIYLFWKRPD